MMKAFLITFAVLAVTTAALGIVDGENVTVTRTNLLSIIDVVENAIRRGKLPINAKEHAE